MMRDRGLGKMDAKFDIGGAQAIVLANRGSATLLESLQNSTASRVGDGMKHAIQGLLSISHDETEINLESMVVNMTEQND